MDMAAAAKRIHSVDVTKAFDSGCLEVVGCPNQFVLFAENC